MSISIKHISKGALALFASSLLLSGCIQSRTIGGNVDDTTSDVSLKTKLLQDGQYDYSDIDITVFEGRMMVTGTMRTLEGKQHVAELASKATNVEEVLDEVIVGRKTPFAQGTTDALINERLGFALLADNGVIRANYQFSVSDGVVYIIGVAQGPDELKRATDHARTIKGVKRVVSHVIYVGDPRRETRAK
ncbi:MAG: BON domain-containing protein [bacterium]